MLERAPLLEIDDVSVAYHTRGGLLPAVIGASLTIQEGEAVGLVGESGCGKSTLGRMVAGILPVSQGEVRWNGRDIATMSADERRAGTLRTQMIFQNPFASLNPRLRVAEIVGEAPRVHGLIQGDEQHYVDAQLRRAGLDPALKWRYPHQFSGGQRQRIGIARALAVQPEVLVCDEAVAALDVSIRAQVLNLLKDIQADAGVSYLFISHDLSTLRFMADRIAIMYVGRLVEYGTSGQVFSQPAHPYTQALMAAVPDVANLGAARPAPLPGEPPNPASPPPGCAFHPRCPLAVEICRTVAPPLVRKASGQLAACHVVPDAPEVTP